jgi:hypothetical protein
MPIGLGDKVLKSKSSAFLIKLFLKKFAKRLVAKVIKYLRPIR